MESKLVRKLRPYLAAVLLQFGYAGLVIIAKAALDKGMSHFTFAVYRNIVAAAVVAPFAFTLERKIRPRMTFSIFYKIFLLALLEPVIDQNLYYVGMKYTTATFAAAMCNTVPAVTFLLAWALRLERVSLGELHSQAKIVGTIVTVGGAMIMTLVKGSVIDLPWTKSKGASNFTSAADEDRDSQNAIRGAVMIMAACFCWSIFYILQAITLKSYPAGISLTGLICMVGALQGTVLTFAVERGNVEIWAIGWDTKLLAAVYSYYPDFFDVYQLHYPSSPPVLAPGPEGVLCSGVAYYVSGVIMKEKGPVFVTSFNPLNMVITAVLSSFILAEQLNVGKVVGATVIVVGLYFVIWGKTRDGSIASCPDSKIPQQDQTSNAAESDYPHINKKISDDNAV